MNRKFLFILMIALAGILRSNIAWLQITVKTDTFRVFFQFDQFRLSKTERTELVNLLNQQKDQADSVKIIGSTDTLGTTQYNDRLSFKRAYEIRDILKSSYPFYSPTSTSAMGIGESGGSVPDSLQRKVTIVFYRTILLTQVENSKDTGSRKTKKQLVLLMELSDILFEPNKPILTPASVARMNYYINQLRQYQNDSIEIRGHVNQTGKLLQPTDPFFVLSVNRAKLIYEYLTEAGFSRQKMSFKGMGNAQLLFPQPKTVDEQMKNMRVEVIIYK